MNSIMAELAAAEDDTPQSGDCHQFPPLELAGCPRFAPRDTLRLAVSPQTVCLPRCGSDADSVAWCGRPQGGPPCPPVLAAAGKPVRTRQNQPKFVQHQPRRDAYSRTL